MCLGMNGTGMDCTMYSTYPRTVTAQWLTRKTNTYPVSCNLDAMMIHDVWAAHTTHRRQIQALTNILF